MSSIIGIESNYNLMVRKHLTTSVCYNKHQKRKEQVILGGSALAQIIATPAKAELCEIFKHVLGTIENAQFSPEQDINNFVKSPS